MPNQDGTGPQGQGPKTGRLRGKCGAGRGNNSNNADQKPGRKNSGGNSPRGGSGRGLTNSNNTTNK